MNPDQPSTPRPGGTPSKIDPDAFPALEDLRQHCRRGGKTLIDRVYADALRMWQRLKEAEDLAGINTPGHRVISEAFGSKDVWGQDRKPSVPKVQTLTDGEEML